MLQLINKINMNLKLSNKKFVIQIKEKNKYLLLYFLKINIIKFLKKYRKSYIIILNILKNKKIIFNIKNMYKRSKIFYINSKFLKKNIKNKNILVLSTNKGIKNN